MDNDTDLYTHIEFIEGEVRFQDNSHPIPCWPFHSVNELIDLREVTDGVSSYFSNLSTGMFLCTVKTAQNFEAYGLMVNNSKSTWYDIMTKWISHFTGTDINCNALRALFNRRLARFQEIQKRCNVRGNLKMKETMIAFLNSKITLPKQKPRTLPDSNVPINISNFHGNTDESEVENSHPQAVYNNIVKERNSMAKSVKIQTTIIKKQSEKAVKEENNLLRNELKSSKKELTVLREISGNEVALRKQVEHVKNRNIDLSRKTKQVTELKRKNTHQTKKLQQMENEIKNLSYTATEAITNLQEKESEIIELKDQLANNKRQLGNVKKKVQRREKNISKLHEQISHVKNRFETDKKSTALYYEGIVDTLQNKHHLSVENLNKELDSMKALETKRDGKYKAEVRLMYYDLLTKGVSANTVKDVVKSVLEYTTDYDVEKVQLPSRTTAQRMVSEAGSLVAVRAAYEMAKQTGSFGHQSDGTTKHLIHWGAHAIKMIPNDDPSSPQFFTLTVSPVISGKADDTVAHLQEQFMELNSISKELNLNSDEKTFSVARMHSRMSDRAANEKKVTRLLREEKEAILREDDDWNECTIDQRKELSAIHSFTCASHKINNMAVAMTSASAKLLYGENQNIRGMRGAKKHIYECNKLLCEHGRKEYGLGNQFKAYSLCSDEDTGSSLFKPIVGNRYLIFMQNSIPTLAGRDMVLLFLEDVRDAKENPGLNRLEQSVQQGYLDPDIQAEEAAFALFYYELCAPLLQRAKSVHSPLEMNKFYLAATTKLEQWSNDPMELLAGDVTMWDDIVKPEVYTKYIEKLRTSIVDNETVKSVIKEMAQAGYEKLHDHSVEHLPGGEFYNPSRQAVEAAKTIGEATNDRIESMFGMLDRHMMFAPASNPLNVSSMIAAKQDKPVKWAKTCDLPLEKIVNVAMKHSAKKRKREGTRNEQTKRRYLAKKFERDALICKRRRMRIERQRRLEENIKSAKKNLCRSVEVIQSMTKSKLYKQCVLWRAVSSCFPVHNIEVIKNFIAKSVEERKVVLIKLVKSNKKLNFKSTKSVIHEHETEEWSSSDEETLDMMRPLVSMRIPDMMDSSDDEFLSEIARKKTKV